MLSANPCLTNIEVEQILKSTATKIGPYTYNEEGYHEEVGYGQINALKALQPSNVDPVSGTETWEEDRNIYNDLIIENGGNLTIANCTIYMSRWAKIIVEPGCTLTLDHCTITGICSSTTWPGIQVWGTSDAPQMPPPGFPQEQGNLVLRNGATIENAIIAVDLRKPGDINSTGGIIQAWDATFKNNTCCVHASHYHNISPPNQELDNMGTFSNCSFIIDEQYLGNVTFYKHVDLDDVRGFKFYGCSFSLDHEASNVSPWNVGIAA